MARSRARKRERVSARKRLETHKSGFVMTSLNVDKDVKFFKTTAAGVRRVDVIPYRAGKGNPVAEEGELHFERTYWSHRAIGPNNESYVCRAKTAGLPCPVCEHRAKLAADPNGDEALVKQLAPRERQLWNVVDVDDDDGGVQLWDISFHLFGKLLDAEITNADEDEEYEYFADLEDGYTLKLGFEEKKFGQGRPYYEVVTIGFKARKQGYDEDILEQVVCLDDALIIPDYDELKKIFLQMEDADDEPDEPPKRRKRRAPKDEDEDEDGDLLTAEEAGIAEGDLVSHAKFGDCEIVRISKDGTSLVIEDDEGKSHRAVAVADVDLVGEPGDDPEEDDEEQDRGPVEPKRRRRAPKDEDEDEDDDPPKRRRRAPKDEDEDEDDDPPKRRKRRAPKDEDEDEDDGKKEERWDDWD